MDLLRISWDATIDYCERLAGMVKDFEPQVIVGISRGGLVPARILSDILGVGEVAVLGIKFYKGIGKSAGSPRIVQELNMDLAGKRVLIVDDVADTGRSLIVARDYLKTKGAGEIRIATIYYKPNSEYKPDYFIGTASAWIVYPWERHEIERELEKSE